MATEIRGPPTGRRGRHRCASMSEYYESGQERTPLLGYTNARYDLSSSTNTAPDFDSTSQRMESGQHCHDGSAEVSRMDKKAMKKLMIASVLCFLFIILEVTGGILANSLAIATDAAHMLTDFCSFLISMFSLFIASRAPTKRMSFGWYRAEVMGALVSVMMIWVVTGVLVYLAIQRVITQDYEIDASIMLITSALAVAFNIIMGVALHDTHGHSHGGHGHSHGGLGHGSPPRNIDQGNRVNGHSNNHTHPDGASSVVVPASPGNDDPGNQEQEAGEMPLNRNVSGNYGATGQSTQVILEDSTNEYIQQSHSSSGRKSMEHNTENINVRAAFIHVLGDLLQSVGVLIAAYIIYYKPEWKLADPICTFIFSVLVTFTTFNILRDAVQVLMEGTPANLSYKEIKDALNEVPGVKEIHNLRIWSLTVNKVAVAVHLAIDRKVSHETVLRTASALMHDRFSILECTIQIEEYVEEMEDCVQCQEPRD